MRIIVRVVKVQHSPRAESQRGSRSLQTPAINTSQAAASCTPWSPESLTAIPDSLFNFGALTNS